MLRDECIRVVKEGLKTSLDVAAAIMQIRDDRLYLETHDSFEDFCKEVLGITRDYAYRLIGAAKVKKSLPKNLSSKITNERQARELGRVAEDDRPDVVRDADKNGRITGESLKQASLSHNNRTVLTTVNTNQPTKTGKSEKPIIELDEIGIPIPEDGLPFWARKQEVQDLLTQISRIKCTIENAKNSDDPMFAKVSNAVISELERVYAHVMEAKPYAICTTCMGRFTVQPKGCSFCGNKGLISKWQWDNQSRKEVKEMRMKMAAKRATA